MEINLHLVEDDTSTMIHTRLDLRGDHFEATGTARRNPIDPPSPAVGEELALARALQDLAGQLLDTAQHRIEHFSTMADSE